MIEKPRIPKNIAKEAHTIDHSPLPKALGVPYPIDVIVVHVKYIDSTYNLSYSLNVRSSSVIHWPSTYPI